MLMSRVIKERDATQPVDALMQKRVAVGRGDDQPAAGFQPLMRGVKKIPGCGEMFDDVTGDDGVEVRLGELSQLPHAESAVRKVFSRQRDGGRIDVETEGLALQLRQSCRKLTRVAPDVEDAPAGLWRQ